MNLNPYPSYKDSGVEWIGEIPEGWEIVPLGIQVNTIFLMRGEPQDLDGDTTWIRIEDFNEKYIETPNSGQEQVKEYGE